MRLIDDDRDDRALLMERVVPGTFLEQAGTDEIAIGADILGQLHVPVPRGSTYRDLDSIGARLAGGPPRGTLDAS